MHIFPPTSSYNSRLLGDAESEAIFSGDRVLGRLLTYESALIQCMANAGLVSDADAGFITDRIKDFVPDSDRLGKHNRQDGVIVPELVRQLRDWVGADRADAIHPGATSQDLIDTSTAMALVEHARLVSVRIAALLSQIQSCEDRFGSITLMGYTRMQKAQTIDFAHRMNTWKASLNEISESWPALTRSITILQFGGPVGDRSGFNGKLPKVAKGLARELNLHDPGHAWHANRKAFLDYGSTCAAITSFCGKIGKDIGLMVRDGTVHLQGGGTSSAMPHKSNPVDAEILVTIAVYSSCLLPALHHSAMGEMERSGSMWTLEWIVLPQLCILAAKSLSLAEALLLSIEEIPGGRVCNQ